MGVRETTLADAAVEAGAETTVTATVENAGGAAGERTLTLMADGEPVDATDVTLDSGESTTVTFSVAFETTGTYDLAVDGTPVGELSVDEESASTETTSVGEDGTGSDGGVSDSDASSSPAAPTEEPGGFGLVDLGRLTVLVAAVVAVLTLARRRRQSWSRRRQAFLPRLRLVGRDVFDGRQRSRGFAAPCHSRRASQPARFLGAGSRAGRSPRGVRTAGSDAAVAGVRVPRSNRADGV